MQMLPFDLIQRRWRTGGWEERPSPLEWMKELIPHLSTIGSQDLTPKTEHSGSGYSSVIFSHEDEYQNNQAKENKEVTRGT